MTALEMASRDFLDERAQAQAEYLAVSRGAHLYESAEEYERAETEAWARLQAAVAACEGVGVP